VFKVWTSFQPWKVGLLPEALPEASLACQGPPRWSLTSLASSYWTDRQTAFHLSKAFVSLVVTTLDKLCRSFHLSKDYVSPGCDNVRQTS